MIVIIANQINNKFIKMCKLKSKKKFNHNYNFYYKSKKNNRLKNK
jgi:hypothetical protein